MSRKPHTPGPWEVRPSSNPANGFGWRDVVSVGTEFRPSYVAEALEQDTSLIASAPELLAALQMVRNDVSFGHLAGCVIAQVYAAIAKADGGQT